MLPACPAVPQKQHARERPSATMPSAETSAIHGFTAASDIAAEVRAETKRQPPIPFGIGGLVRADLTVPGPRTSGVTRSILRIMGPTWGSKGGASNVGNGNGNRRCQQEPQRRISNGGASYGGTSNGENGNGESRRYQRNRKGRGVGPARANRNGLP